MNYLKKVLYICSLNKGNLFFLGILYLIISLLDILGITLIGSFVTLILSPDYLNNILDNLTFINIETEGVKIHFYFGISVIFIFIFKTIFALISYKQIINYSYNTQSIIREKIMKSCTEIEYEEYTNLDTSKYVQMTGNMVKTFGSVLIALLQTTGDFIVFIIISIFLIYINYIFYLTIISLSLIYFLIYKTLFLNQLINIGIETNKNYYKLYKNIKEFFQGFKEIKILKINQFFLTEAKISANNISKLDIKNAFITFAPKYFLEVFFIFIVIVFFFYSLELNIEKSKIISSGTFFIASMIRLIPSLLQFIRFKSTINLGKNSVDMLYNEIHLINKSKKIINKKNTITKKEKFEEMEFKNVCFSYKSNPRLIFDNINLKISKNSIIGVSGDSGNGKTSFIDLMTGLLKPTSGEIILNNKYVNEKFYLITDFAYISQKPFLINDTIRNNIIIKKNKDSKINEELFLKTLKISHLQNFIDIQKDGYNSFIGEDGAKISGGQKQRIAIARSLYHNKNFLILDEPTSALDKKTAEKIIKELIYNKNKYQNIIIISHSKNILKLCDKILRIQNNKITEV